MAKAFDQAKALLAELTPAELALLAERIAALQALGGQGRREGQPSAESAPGRVLARFGRGFEAFAEQLYGALVAAMGKEGMPSHPPYSVFVRNKHSAVFLRAAQTAYSAHCFWFPSATRIEQVKLTRIYAEAIVARCGKWGWKGIVGGIEALQSILADAFPGYVRSGLQSVILKHNIGEGK